jgi:hypothetical protein
MKATRDESTGRWTLEGVEDDAVTFERICDNLKSGKNFKFARYGDGELMCMNGKIGRNCDKHQYFPKLGIKLLDTVQHKMDYMIGIQPLSVAHLPHLVDDFILKNYKPSEIFNADCIHNASIDGKMDQFFHALEGKYIILVGPAHLAGLFEEMVHIVVPNVDAWNVYDEIHENITYHLEDVKNAVVLLSCGMMAECLIFDFATKKCTMIDTGSVFDPYAGVYSRSYHYKLKKNDV